MNLHHLLEQTSPIPSHAIAALIAIALGAWQLYAKKGTKTHRYLGYAWVALMLYVSISSFWIHKIKTIGAFSPIHLLSLLTLYFLYKALKAAKQHNIKKHQRIMKLIYFLGLIMTGLLTLLPNRVMHDALFTL